jgi:hypothetical protein
MKTTNSGPSYPIEIGGLEMLRKNFSTLLPIFLMIFLSSSCSVSSSQIKRDMEKYYPKVCTAMGVEPKAVDGLPKILVMGKDSLNNLCAIVSRMPRRESVAFYWPEFDTICISNGFYDKDALVHELAHRVCYFYGNSPNSSRNEEVAAKEAALKVLGPPHIKGFGPLPQQPSYRSFLWR